jgi:CRISPR-associated endonuclease/helicase Cas3
MGDPGSGDLDAWLACAAGRPALQLWGKAHPGLRWPAHPLLCHMLDVAAVAARLLTGVVSAPIASRLLSIHPDRARALGLLLFTVAIHDIGKATPAFQGKVEPIFARLRGLGFDGNPQPKDRHHGDIGLLPAHDALVGLGFEQEDALRLARAVTAHHGQFPTDFPNVKKAGMREMGPGPRWEAAREQSVQVLAQVLGLGEPPVSLISPGVVDHGYVILLAGLTSVADWLGSMSEVFEYEAPPTSLDAYWNLALSRADAAVERAGFASGVVPPPRSFCELFPELAPWPLHTSVEALAPCLDGPSLVIVEAPMGEGKTEAALFLAEANAARAGLRGLFIGLPTQATANQMLGRVQLFLEGAHPGEKLNLLLAHGEASLVERFEKLRLAAIYDAPLSAQSTSGSATGSVRAEGWFLSKKRALLADHAVGTIDQALLAVMLVPHGFVRLYGLAGKTVVLDEVHAYDTYTGTLLDRLLEWLAALGAGVVLLSATLPRRRREALCAAYARGRGLERSDADAVRYPRVTIASARQSSALTFAPRGAAVAMTLESSPIDVGHIVALALEAMADGGCVGCIFNTVARAQEAFELVRQARPELHDRILLHARLFPDERNRREQRLEAWLGPERRTRARPIRAIVIGTQVLEQSLDIDFDVLFTDIAPIDLVLQRSGRLFRHARTNRAKAHARPRLIVARPASDDGRGLKEVAGIYAELLVRRTLDVLEARSSITLPTDIEPLVELVYDASTIPAPGDPLYDVFLEHEGMIRSQAMIAAQKVLPSPSVEDDPFGDLKVFLDDDDDPVLHNQLRAATRLGPPSIDIVCLERLAGGGVSLGDDVPFDIHAEPDRAMTARIVRRSISVTRPGLVRSLIDQASPKAWQQAALLRYRRPITFDGGRAVVGDLELRIDAELGLVISSPAVTPP